MAMQPLIIMLNSYAEVNPGPKKIETFSYNFEMTLETLLQKGSFPATTIGNLTLNLITGTIMMKRSSKVVPLNA